ncbi:serine hydrolase domain-containing protein [Actinosynnema sp. NPDC020468]|uniref:serine hydrolase domain-containing protein n=1 Tax=Actinosynnema sp. NPDC020468 TaxID=3154488 RepID=UPI0033E041F2
MITTMLTALLLVAPVAPAAAVTAADVDAVVERYRAEVVVPGVAVAVTRGGTVVRTAGYGVTGDGEPVTDRTTMAVGSVGKSFTALAVLKLVEDGRLGLDDRVRDRLPEFTTADPRSAAITVRQLLAQTSGLADTGFRAFSGPQPTDLRGAVAAMRDARLVADPGTAWHYHNPNYQVAARLVEVVAGRPFATYLREVVLGPLGMTDSRAVDREYELPPSARGHVEVLGTAFAAPEPAGFGGGSGGVLSSARDLASWLIAHRDGRGPDGTAIVSPATVALAHTEVADGYALGWFAHRTPSGARLVDHGGDLFTATAYQALLPDSGYGVAVLANTGLQYRAAQSVGDRLIALLEGRTSPPPSDPTPLVDGVLLALTAAVVVPVARGVRRARRWVVGRRVPVVRLLPLLLPAVLLGTVHRVVGHLYRGRDVAWRQIPYLYPTFTVLLGTTALGCAVVLVARVVALGRRRFSEE